MPGIRLSVLDLAPVWSGSSTREALNATLDLAVEVERLGFTRFWVAEHHNSNSIASSSPAVLIGRLADVTTRLRVGSGGVLLPNHPPLVVAEQFGTLEALHPGRIDLGLGRAPGTDPLTATALRRSPAHEAGFAAQIAELGAYFEPLETSDPERRMIGLPAPGNRPKMWMLGSSPASGLLAGELGMPYAFAHHINSVSAVPAVTVYRESFQPSAFLDEPYAIVAASVIAAESDDRARHLAGPLDIVSVRMRGGGGGGGRLGPLPTPAQAAEYVFSPQEQEMLRHRMGSHVVGGPDTIRRELTALVEATGADELMVLSMMHDPADRLESLRLLTEVLPFSPDEGRVSAGAV
jgi:luciferase family oxidoreductase group 1